MATPKERRKELEATVWEAHDWLDDHAHETTHCQICSLRRVWTDADENQGIPGHYTYFVCGNPVSLSSTAERGCP